jgi:glucose-1-phosphatase
MFGGGMMAAPMYDFLLFDLGGVLVHFAGFAELGRLLPAGLEAAAVRERWIHSPAVHSFERGDFGGEEFAARFLAEWPVRLAPAEFLRSFAEWNRGPYPGALELLHRLRRDYRLACLSNANEVHAPTHRQRLGAVFERYYFSHELGCAKPSAEIFARVLADLGVPAARIAYFDDTVVNVDAARAAGMSAYLTDGLPALAQRLAGLGIDAGDGG